MQNSKGFIVGIATLGLFLVLTTISKFSSSRLNVTEEKEADLAIPFEMKANTFVPPVMPSKKTRTLPMVPAVPVAATVTPDKSTKPTKVEAKKKEDKKKKKKKVAEKKTPNYWPNLAQYKKVLKAIQKQAAKPSALTVAIMPIQKIQPNSNEPQKDDKTKTLAQWEEELLYARDVKATDELVSDFNGQKLKDPSWFYILTKKMLDSNNVAVQHEGVRALRLAGAHYQSYTLLTDYASKKEDPIRQEINIALQDYAQKLNYTAVLFQGLQSAEPALQIQSAQYLDQSASHNLHASSGTPEDLERGRRSASSTPQNTTTAIPYYQKFVPLLAQLRDTNSDPQLKTVFGETLNKLQSLLSSPTLTAAATPF